MEHVHFQDSPMFRVVISTIHVLEEFDRTGVSAIAHAAGLNSKGAAYGSVSRIFSELSNDGYIVQKVKPSLYGCSAVRRNPVLADFAVNYSCLSGCAGRHKSDSYAKTERWGEFLDRYKKFLGPAQGRLV